MQSEIDEKKARKKKIMKYQIKQKTRIVKLIKANINQNESLQCKQILIFSEEENLIGKDKMENEIREGRMEYIWTDL